MKKRMLSILLAAVMLLAVLTACGGNGGGAGPVVTEKPATVAGVWSCEMDYTDFVNKAFGSELGDMAEYFNFDGFVIEIMMTLNEDGTYKMTADTEKSRAALDNLWNQIKDGLTAYMTDMAEEYGVTLDELLEASETTVEDMMTESFGGTNDVFSMILGGVEQSGEYEAKDGKLYMSENGVFDKSYYEEYVLEGDTLTITGDSTGETEVDGFKVYPQTFKRVG